MKNKKKVLSKVNKNFLKNLENMCKRKSGKKENTKNIIVQNPIKKEKPKIKTIKIREKTVQPQINRENDKNTENNDRKNNYSIINLFNDKDIIKYGFYYMVSINIVLIVNPILFYILYRYF